MFKLFLLLIILSSNLSFAASIEDIENKTKSEIGIYAVNLKTGKSFGHREDEFFKMASTFKIPVAAALLDLECQNKISLNKMINIHTYDLMPGSGKMGYFLIRDGLAISIYNLLEPMITISDNSATDLLIKEIGGISHINQFLYRKGINNIFIKDNIFGLFMFSEGVSNIPDQKERNIQKLLELIKNVPQDQKERAHKIFNGSLSNSASPKAMTNLLVKLYNGELICKRNAELLIDIMGRTDTGKCRIAAILEKDDKFHHKTGSWYFDDKKYSYAADTGIIYSSKGDVIAISIFAKSDQSICFCNLEKAISEAAKISLDKVN